SAPSSRRGRRPAGVSKGPVGRRSPAAVSATGCMSGRPQRLSRSGRLIRTEVNRMASSPREALSTLPDPVLHDLAKAHGLDPTRYPNRTSLIEALASLADVESLLAEAERRRMEYHLERLRPRQLRELGERHRVSLLGLKRKSDLVAALATAPGSSEILLELEAQDAADREAGFVLGRDADVDYERVEELLEQARKRFQERQFEAALTAGHRLPWPRTPGSEGATPWTGISFLRRGRASSRPAGVRRTRGFDEFARSRNRSDLSPITSPSPGTSAQTRRRRSSSIKPRGPRSPSESTATPEICSSGRSGSR